jgi:hydrogenase nickel incorporation protein HypB
MCKVCGCGEGEVRIEAAGGVPSAEHGHTHAQGHRHHDDLHFGHGPAGVAVAGMDQERLVRIEQDILAKNAGFAEENRAFLDGLGILALNLVSSPGAGKTTLLVETIKALKGKRPIAVIEGDQETSNDAERIRATGVAAVQINTGRGCHLDAHMVGHAFEGLPLEPGALLFIENIGNLVCPAGFDLGEAHKVVILSVTEGDDKPIKYPDIFAAADLMLVSKLDLLPHTDFDLKGCVEKARRVNPRIETIVLSARTGEGMEAWLDWIMTKQR